MKVKNSKVITANLKNIKLKQVLLIVLGSLNAITSVAFALSIQWVLEGFLSPATAILDKNTAVIISVLLVVGSFIITAITNVLSEKFKLQAELTVKKDVLRGFLNAPYSVSKLKQVGEMVSRLQTDIPVFVSSYIMVVPQIAVIIIRLIAIVVALFALSPSFTVVLILSGAVIILVTYFVKKVIKRLYKSTREADEKVTSSLTEAGENLLAVKGLRAENEILNGISNKLSVYEKARKKQRYFQAGFSSVNSLYFNIIYLVAIIVSLAWSLGGMGTGEAVSSFALVSIVQLLMQARGPFTSFSGVLNSYFEREVLADRIAELKALPQDYCVPDAEFEGVNFVNVCFSYEDEKVINDFNLIVSSGDKVLIKGKTGVGKSTLLKLASGVYKPDSGSVSGKFDKGSIDAYRLKKIFAVAFQGNTLFSGTLKENLTLLKEDATLEEINDAIKFACLDDVILSVGGLDGEILENGNNISEGQRQRVAIARAYLSGYPVLILDEPSSALDIKTESEMFENIKNCNRTVIAVSHSENASGYFNKTVEL